MPDTLGLEIEQLWVKWIQERDRDACDSLIRLYMPLVKYHVRRVSAGLPRNVSKEDLESHGMLGLYDALEKFDRQRDLKFDTYASFRIRGAILDGLRKEDWLPRSMREKIKKIETTIDKLEQQLSRYVTAQEVAKEVGMEEKEVSQLISESFMANILSMDDALHDTDKEESYKASIVDATSKTPEEVMLVEATKKELAKAITELTEKEQLVVSLFYFDELTLTEIGEMLNLSTSRISQIHSKALFRLQQIMLKERSK